MQEILNEIKQKERDGKELVGKTKIECEEKIILARKNLQEKYNAALASFQKEAGTVFTNKKREIENEIRCKLEIAEKERDLIIKKAEANFPKACEFVRKQWP